MLTQWEQDHERYLIVHNERYLDTIDRQWGEKKQLEEQEKLEKVKCVRGERGRSVLKAW